MNKIKKINGIKFGIIIYTDGEEKYKRLTRLFIKNTKLAILVYSLDDEESFNSLYYLELIKSMNDETVIYGVCANNKSDLASDMIISDEKRKECAKKIGAGWTLFLL